MPYIKQSQRENLDPAIVELANRIKLTCEQDKCDPDGMLNYIFTKLILDRMVPGPNYVQIERAVGCLESCKLEFYRRFAGPYENKKVKENGDVFTWVPEGQLVPPRQHDPKL